MKREHKNIIFTVIFYLLSYSLMLYPHYSPDSFFYHENRIANSEGTGNLALGRFGNYIINKIAVFFDFDCIESQLICTIFLILCLSFATEVICRSFNKLYKNDLQKHIGRIAVYISFCNVFLLEWFIFIEAAFQWAFSIMFMALAFMQIREEFTLKRIILSIVFQSVSVGFYQATIGYFVIFSLLWIYVYSNGVLNKKTVFLNIKALLCGALAGISNIIFIRVMQKIGRIYETSRTEQIGFQTLIHNIKSIYNDLDYILIRNFNLFPRGILIIFVCASYILVLYCIIRKIGNKIFNRLIYLLFILICCRGIVYFPHIVSSQIWMAQRTLVSFWTIISIPIIVICSLNVDKLSERISLLIIGIVLFFNIIYIQFISVEVIANNKIDEELSYYIYNRITEYEKETGITVDKIYVCNDENVSRSHNAIHFKAFDLNKRLHSVEWSCVQCINFYNNQSYHGYNMDSAIYEEYFAGKDWNVFNVEEQLVFIDDALYLAIY